MTRLHKDDTYSVEQLVHQHLADPLQKHGFEFTETDRDGPMGSQSVTLENQEFFVHVLRDRGGDRTSIQVTAKHRPRPRAHLRSYYVSSIRGYQESTTESILFEDFASEARWFALNVDIILSTEFLNSEALCKWQRDYGTFGRYHR